MTTREPWPKILLTVSAYHAGTGPLDSISAFRRKLLEIFETYPSDTYFRTLHGFLISWNVAGKFDALGGREGPGRLRRPAKSDWLIIDLVIPEYQWREKRRARRRRYIGDGMRQCFELLVERCRKKGELLDEAALRRDFEAGMARYYSEPDPPYPDPEVIRKMQERHKQRHDELVRLGKLGKLKFPTL